MLKLALTKGDGLISETQGVAHAALSRARNDAQCVVLKIHAFGVQHFSDVIDNRLSGNVFELELQAPRQHGHWDFLWICSGQQELYVLWRLFEGLEQRVKTGNGEHMHFVDQVDLVAAAGRHVLGVLQ